MMLARCSATACLAVLLSGVLAAQTPAPAPAAPAAPATAQPAPAEPPQGYTYNPDGRRDPFVSLLKSGSDGQRQTLGTRPAGLAGLLSSEVSLKGTFQSANGYVGLLQGSDSKTYIVKTGDKLFDGTVRQISANAMVILQQVNDPLSLQKEREVRKVLRQTDEVK
jgi:type IV pilus assembly protein PilP